MRILATGGTGFLGRHLIPALEAAGHDVLAPRSAECDLRRPGALAAFCGDRRFDLILHMAAWTRAGSFCRENVGEQWRVHQAMDSQVLGFWADQPAPTRLVCFGTSVAYAPSLELHHEEHYLDGEPSEHYFGYAMAKRSLYGGARAISAQYGLPFIYLVPSTLYGPGYHLDGRPLHFVYDLVRKILRGARYGEDVTLWGDGHQRRELVFIDDAVSWILGLIESEEAWKAGAINLGAGSDASIREFAEEICRAAGYAFEDIQFDTDAFVGAQAKRLGTCRLEALLPGRQQTPLRDGVAATVEWARRHLHELG